MAMDTSIKDSNKDKWNGNGQEQTNLRNGTSKNQKNKNGKTGYTVAVNKNNRLSKDEIEYGDDNISCGLGPCAPNWMQVLASKQAFLVVFCLTWVLQGMFATYFVSVITTIEKLFQLQSKVSGLIMSATELGQISCTLLFTYYGGQGHRPRWIAWGMVLFAACAFICSSPHFLFGYPPIPGNDLVPGQNLSANNTFYALCQTDAANLSETCNKPDEIVLPEQQARTKNIVLIIFLVSLLGVGMGQTPVYTLGISFIDDNVASRESPLYFAITIGIRILGPALGFVMGSLCTRLFIDLSAEPKISPTDPRWLGAWWLGLVLDAGLLLLASFAMFAFPTRLRSTPAVRKRQNANKVTPKLKDFPKTLNRLMRNDILMYRTTSSVLHILPIAGLYTFLPKYLESQFRFPAYTANMVTGIGGILVMGVGIIISGIFILRFKPNARFVAAWLAGTALLYSLGMAILMFVGCPMDDLVDVPRIGRGPTVPMVPDCISSCHCDTTFSPVCGADKFTHFSACYAGCRNITSDANGTVQFFDCSCLKYPNSSLGYDAPDMHRDFTAKIGYCDFECNSFTWYILIFSFFVFIHSTSEVGSMLLTLRCVDPRDKAMALGIIQFAIGSFGNVPCSVIYGFVVDSACIIWDTVCDKVGACSLYDADAFRVYFHGTTSALMFSAFIVDMIVWYKADNIKFGTDDEEAIPEPQEEELTPIADKTCCENDKN